MLRRIFVFLLWCPVAASAQPVNYYNNAMGLNGAALRNALHNIIMNHTSVGYAGLWTVFQQTDARPDGKVWDIYSDKPGQTPPYLYTFIADQCGNYTAEGDCYNREHTFPQSYFNSTEPMKSDLFQVYPTDGFVNGKRSNYMYGVVSNPSYTSQNGSKVGLNVFSGSPSGIAFEPIDSFKGDLARTYFYVATRYLNEDNGWSNWEMANGAELKPWAITMLLQWHHDDPVSQKELNRNNSVYAIQSNRNPFIDYPVFADCIWGNGDCSGLGWDELTQGILVTIAPNPVHDVLQIKWRENDVQGVFRLEVLDSRGQKIWNQSGTGVYQVNLSVADWPQGIYIVKLQTRSRSVQKKVLVGL